MAYFLVYVSSAARLMSTAELRELLTTCRSRNEAARITGALLYRDGTFMQVLEGDNGPSVVRVFDKIEADPRHHDVTFMIDGHTERRQFADWSMAFRDLTADVDDLANGYSEFMSSRAASYGPDPTIAQRLLLTFRRTLSATN